MKRKGKIGLIIGLVVFLILVTCSILAVTVAMSRVKDMMDNPDKYYEDFNEPGSSDQDDTVLPDDSTPSQGEEDGDSGSDSEAPSLDDEQEEKPLLFMMHSEPDFAFSHSSSGNYTGIRFLTTVPYTLREAVESDSTKTICTMIAPLDYFEQVYDSSVDEMDWVAAFQNAGLSFVRIENESKFSIEDGRVVPLMASDVIDIKYTNTNRKFTAISYVETVNGDGTTRSYAVFEEGQDFRTIARSLGYVAVDFYNQMISRAGDNVCSDENVAVSKAVNNSVDLTHGQEAETENDNSTYYLSEWEDLISVSMDFQVGLNYVMSPVAEVPIFWYSENPVIATVENGVVKGINEGSTTIVAVLCGNVYKCKVVVTERTSFEDSLTYLEMRALHDSALQKMTARLEDGSTVNVSYATLYSKGLNIRTDTSLSQDSTYRYSLCFESGIRYATVPAWSFRSIQSFCKGIMYHLFDENYDYIEEPDTRLMSFAYNTFAYASQAALNDVSCEKTDVYCYAFEHADLVLYSPYTAEERASFEQALDHYEGLIMNEA